MIHGSKRNKKEKSEQEIKDEDELSQKINSKLAEFFSISRSQVLPQQIPKMIEFTALLMQLCSDIPTIFNFRRQLIQAAKSVKSPSQIGQLLSGEIKLTTKLIQSDPKSYTIWSYRQWLVVCLFNFNPAVIKAEKDLCKMLLLKDQKNFHVWNYRNWLNGIQLQIEEEIAFTQDKIKSNPFNFSPYHFRSKLITQKYQNILKGEVQESLRKQIITFGMPKQLMESELQRVKTAIFLNPNEEAPWLFYNWLLAQTVPAFIVKQQKIEDKIVLTLNMKVSDFSKLSQQSPIILKGKSGKLHSDIWQTESINFPLTFKSNLQQYEEIKLQTTGRLILGTQKKQTLITEHTKQLLQRQLTFIDQVIESQQKKCRFACLQKSYICKFLLQCGTTKEQFDKIIVRAVSSLLQIKDQLKGKIYTEKQLEYWQRLERGQLSHLQKALQTRFEQ